MTTPAIQKHFEDLKKAGLDLGSASGDELDAKYGGRCQRYQGGNIYWHPTTGAHALRGRILERYLQTGGPDLNPATGQRELGFPTSDPKWSDDGCFECVTFEWGIIAAVSGTPLVRIFGPIYNTWRKEGGELGKLGHPISDVVSVEDGQAAWFERGALWHPNGSEDVVSCTIDPPTLGRPLLIGITDPGPLHWITFTGHVDLLDARPNLAAELFRARLELVPVGGGEPLKLNPASAVTSSGNIIPGLTGIARRALALSIEGFGGRNRFPALAGTNILDTLKPKVIDRTLYSLAFTTSGMAPRVISPHCLYARANWETFGLAHITDIHLSRRIEKYRALLRSRGVQEGDIAQINNWNDDFRYFIKHANALHQEGKLDVIILTGDLVDYVREPKDNPDGPGNFGFFEALVRGEAPGSDPESPASEPLKVPVFTCLGNHDYRELPYLLAQKIAPKSGDFLGDLPVVGDTFKDVVDTVEDTLHIPDLVGIATEYFGDRIDQFKGLNLLPNEAAAIMGLKGVDGKYGFPVVRPDAAEPSVTVEKRMRDGSHYYFRRINAQRSYVIALGGNRIVMLDTRWDSGMPSTVSGMVAAVKGIGPESAINFVGSNPDSTGITKEELDLLKTTIAEAGSNVVIVGMHAPPVNPQNTDLSNFLRETVHPSASLDQIMGWLSRNGQIKTVPLGRNLQKHDENPKHYGNWTHTGTPHFHEGPVEDGLDYGIAVGSQEEFVKTLCGAGSDRPVTMVCSGHGHYRIEYRLKWDAKKKKLFTFADHYLGNPAEYYPCRVVEGNWRNIDDHKRYLIRVEPGAPLEGRVEARADYDGTIWEGTKQLAVAARGDSLDQTRDLVDWWQRHAPIVVQTAALGPGVNSRVSKSVNEHPPGPNFQGFRLLHLDKGAIVKADYVLFDEVRKSGATNPPTSDFPSMVATGFVVMPSSSPAQPAQPMIIRDHRRPR